MANTDHKPDASLDEKLNAVTVTSMNGVPCEPFLLPWAGAFPRPELER